MMAAVINPSRQGSVIGTSKWRIPQWMLMPYLSVLGLVLPVLAYLLMMSHLGWRAPVFGDRAQSNAAAVAEGTVYLFVSETNKQYYDTIGGNYEVLVQPWRKYFKARGREYTEISDLDQVRPRANTVVILPSAIAIGADERRTLARLQESGVSVLTTWASGTRNSDGEWTGWDFLQSLGIVVLGEREKLQGSGRQITMSAETPLTLSQAPAQRVWLSPASEPMLRFRGDHIAARLTDWYRVETPGYPSEGAVVYTESRTSRTVGFAFAETSWDASLNLIYPTLDDALLWLQRQPMIALANWPNGYHAAQLVEMDTEHLFGAANALADMLKARGIPGTFFLLTSEAIKDPKTVRRLANDRFDIAYHGDIHIGFAKQSEAEQQNRLTLMRQQLASLDPALARSARGFRAPTEAYEPITERLLQKMGIRYHLVDPSRTQAALPFFLKAKDVSPDDELVVMPRTQRDDLNQLSLTQDPQALLKALTDDMDNNRRDGGLGTLSVHSQNMSPGQPLNQAMAPYLDRLLQYQRSGDLWLASGAQVEQWWRARRNVAVVGSRQGLRLELDISVKGNAPVSGVTVLVMVPARGTVPTIRVTKVGAVQPIVKRVDDYTSQLVFPTLQPGNYAYQVNFSRRTK